MALLKADAIGVRIGGTSVLEGVSFSLSKGQRLGVIGETGAVLSPAARGAPRRDRRMVGRRLPHAGLIACAVVLFLFVRERAHSQVLGRPQAPEGESRLGPRVLPSRRTTV